MSLTTLITAAIIGLATAQTGAAESTSPQAVAQPAAQAVSGTVGSKDDDDKMVCRKVRATGSNMITRDCRTVGQRRKDAETAKDALRNGQSINNLDTGAR